MASVIDPLRAWAREAHWSMGGLSSKRLRLQGLSSRFAIAPAEPPLPTRSHLAADLPMALPLAALFFFLLSSSALSQHAPISLAPSSAPTASTADPLAPSQPRSDDTALSPPAPLQTSPFPSPSESPAPPHLPPSLHSTAPAPAPAADEDDDEREKQHPSPAPAPSAEEIKAGEQPVDADQSERHEGEMSGGRKAGVVVGAFTAAAVVGLAAVAWRKRQANIRRSRYADYSARIELV